MVSARSWSRPIIRSLPSRISSPGNRQTSPSSGPRLSAGHVKIVLLLLGNGADPNVREQGGYTPLHAAAQNGDIQMIRALLFKGADLNPASRNGKLPIDLANEAGHIRAATLLKKGITRRFRTKR